MRIPLNWGSKQSHARPQTPERASRLRGSAVRRPARPAAGADLAYCSLDRPPACARYPAHASGAGVQRLRLPSRSPNLNAYAERLFGRSSTSACGTLSPSASVICAPWSATLWSTTTPSATTRAWATSSPSPPAIRPRPSAASAGAKGSAVCSLSTSERALTDYALSYFNNARSHQGIGQRIPVPGECVRVRSVGSITALPVLGGLHHNYRAAA